MMEALIPFGQVFLAMVILKYACDQFEQPAGYLGRNMPAGIKGATVNAVGSSMPEMMSAFALLFFYDDPALFAVALGITAGSGVFNTAVIPSLAILFARGKDGSTVTGIRLDKRALIRDVFWVVFSDVFLIGLIFYGYISISWAIALNLIYVGYAIHLYVDATKGNSNVVEQYEEESLPDYGNNVLNLLSCNFHAVLFSRRSLNTGSAISLLAISIVIIIAASHLLVEGVIGSATILGIPNFISGLILGAAASSIPDLILSIKDSRKGDYEDAVANPLASNTFDTSISVGLPLLLWLIWKGEQGIEIVGESMEALRISVVAMSFCVGMTLIAKHRRVGKGVAYVILSMYLAWCTWIIVTYI
jgi:cation:H+ antiporter